MPSSINDSSIVRTLSCSEKLLWIIDKSDSESEKDFLEMIDMMNNFKPYLFEPEKDVRHVPPDSDNIDSDGFNQCIF